MITFNQNQRNLSSTDYVTQKLIYINQMLFSQIKSDYILCFVR